MKCLMHDNKMLMKSAEPLLFRIPLCNFFCMCINCLDVSKNREGREKKAEQREFLKSRERNNHRFYYQMNLLDIY